MPTFLSHSNPLSRHPTACPRHPHIAHSHRPPGITPPRWCSWRHHCQTPHLVGYASGLPPSNFRCASSLSPLIGSAGAHHHRRGLMQHHRHREHHCEASSPCLHDAPPTRWVATPLDLPGELPWVASACSGFLLMPHRPDRRWRPRHHTVAAWADRARSCCAACLRAWAGRGAKMAHALF
jgi:hypothetical protein